MLVLAMQFSKSAAKAGPGRDRPLESATALPENGTEMSDKPELEVGDRGLRPLEYIWIAE